MKKKNKKAIGPVVATSLLLIVAIVAVIGFQSWFTYYSSSTLSQIESQSGSNFNRGIEGVVGDKLYFKNGGHNNITITSITVSGNDCNISGNFLPGMVEVTLGNNCTQNLKTLVPEIVVITNSKFFSKNIYLGDSTISSGPFSCDSLPGSWISVTGNLALGTSDFCVMKYEAKNVSGVATSQSALTPWVDINQMDTRANCSSLGMGYHLITDAEWITIAKLAENDASNWDTGVVGVGVLYEGHNDALPNYALVANVNDNNGYYLTGQTTGNQRRTLNISGNMIWDLAGNVMEWDNDTIPYLSRYYGGGNNWMSYSSDDGTGKIITSPTFPSLKLPSNGWNANQGMGRYLDGLNLAGTWNDTSYTGSISGFLRGGAWDNWDDAGVFSLSLDIAPITFFTSYGFRCAYSP